MKALSQSGTSISRATGGHTWFAAHASTLKRATSVVLLIGALLRIGVVAWNDPWGPHHPDEHILPLEAMALWEGITPQEVGWPGSTTMVALSALSVVQCVAQKGGEIWRWRHQPDRALAVVTTWIADRYTEPRPLYQLGRSLSVVTGIAQLFATVWALSQWVGPIGVFAGTAAMALAPAAVLASQYVLADITGLLFATIAVGLAAAPTRRRILIMAVWTALATASKFHFGLWLLMPLLCIWLKDRSRFVHPMRLSAAVIGLFTWVVVTLVPWFWTNPLLALKEFAGVVLVKISSGSTLAGIPSNASTVFMELGALGWAAAAAGLATAAAASTGLAPILVPTLTGTVVLLFSATVFDRYGLVLLPGIVVIAAVAWERWLASDRARVRLAARIGFAACAAATIAVLISSMRIAAEIDVDALVKNWVIANVEPGSRVAIHNEMNAFLPREPAQLRECVDRVETLEAYKEKWAVEGVTVSGDFGEPMRSMVLNDERFQAYWCRKELLVGRNRGFHIVSYHAETRFAAVLESDVIREFRNGARQITGGVDVLVTNRIVDAGVAPVQIFTTKRGQRAIYRHR